MRTTRLAVTSGFTLLMCALLTLISGAGTEASALGPGWHNASTAPVSPQDAARYYQKEHEPAVALLQATRQIEAAVSSATAATPEITELARALQHDAKLIFDYVHNHIDYVPYFGSLKGATLTLLDGSGNDCDQASLTIALLRASGYTANYQYGTMSFPLGPDSPLAHWIGSTDNYQNILASGGVPLSKTTTWNVGRVWVRLTIGGTDYLLDPAFKSYTTASRIDVGQAMDYDRSELLAAAGGNIAPDGSWVQSIDEEGLSERLSEYANNLIATIRAQHPNDSVDEILGRRSIVQSELAQLPTALPFPTTVSETWSDVPPECTATLRIQHAGIDYTLATPELGGQRLTIIYAGAGLEPELRLEGEIIDSGDPTSSGSSYPMILTINHPYAAEGGGYCDQATTYEDNISGSTYAIVYNFGGSSEAIITKRQRLVDGCRAAGLPKTSEAVLGETLNIMGLTWLKECRMAEELLSDLSSTSMVTQHSVGRMAQEESYYIDIATAVINSVPKVASDPTGGLPAFYSGTTVASAFEHAVLEQTMGSDRPAVSTVKLLQMGNAAGDKTFWVTAANYWSIRGQVRNYSTAELDYFWDILDSGQAAWLLLPQNGQLQLSHWRGEGYVLRSGVGDSLAMIIEGSLYGGYSGDPGNADPDDVEDNSWWGDGEDTDGSNDHNYSEEPVEMLAGAYVHNRTDLALAGKGPLGMSFARSYSSSRNRSSGKLGYGWAHSYDICLDRISHSEPGLGGRLPVDAAALLVALYASLDLHASQSDVKGWTTVTLMDKWAVDQLIGSTVTARLGGQILEFVRLPDGSFSSPPAVTTRLADNGDGTFSLQERLGARIDFDAGGRASSITDSDGNAVTFAYDGANVSQVTDWWGRTLSFAYADGRVSSVSDSAGRSVSYTYDVDGNLIGYTDPESKVWVYGYDSAHRMTSMRNPLGVTTVTNTYDSLGRVATQTVPRQVGTAAYNFYFSGFRNAEEDPLGNQIVYFYDGQGRPLGRQDALGNRSTQTHDGQNHTVETVDPRSNTTTYTYDGDQNLVEVTDPLGHATRHTYDPLFRLTTVTDPLQHGSELAYDAENHIVSARDALDNKVTSTYYPNGLVETSTDARETSTSTTYDACGQPLTTQVGSHPPVHYVYDSIGRMLSLTDQEGATTSFQYDKRGLLMSRTDPLGRITKFTYDNAGQLISATDRNGQTIGYSYTPTGKVAVVTLPGGSQIIYSYDSRDNLIGMQDQVGITTYAYDAVNRLVSITDPRGFTVGYTYDPAGNVASVTYPGNRTVVYTYDALNRLQAVCNWLGQTARYGYDEAGRLVSLTNFNGTVTTYASDDANRLTDLENRKSSTLSIANYHFGLDSAGNRTSVRQYEPFAPSVDTASITYTYNTQRNRLVTAGGTSYAYDLEGQLSGAGGVAYGFDPLHRLISVGGPSPAQYVYDGQNRRLQATRGGLMTRYVYDASGNLIAEADDANNITAYYVYGAGLLARVTPAGSTLCYHFNAVGSTIAMTDMTQTVINRYAYDPFGNVTGELESVPQPFEFVGQYGVMAEPNGLCYMRARYYDPATGRFISEDPVGFAGGDLNLYAYAGNNSVMFNDPTGKWTPWTLAIGAVVGGLVGAYCGYLNAMMVGLEYGLPDRLLEREILLRTIIYGAAGVIIGVGFGLGTAFEPFYLPIIGKILHIGFNWKYLLHLGYAGEHYPLLPFLVLGAIDELRGGVVSFFTKPLVTQFPALARGAK